MCSVATRGQCDMVRIAAAGKFGEQKDNALVMDLLAHGCDNPECNQHAGIFNRADIRSIQHSRYKFGACDNEPLGHENQLGAARTTPCKHSMVDLTRPRKFEEREIPSGNDHHNNPPQQPSENATTASMHDRVVVNRDGREIETSRADDQAARFQQFLRKLQRTAQGSPSKDKENIRGSSQRTTQDSSSSSTDTSGSVKRSLNPLAKEFAAISSKERPVVVEKRGSETSMNIPLSILTQIMAKDDCVKESGDCSQPVFNETIFDILRRLGIQNEGPQVAMPPSVGVPPVALPFSVPPLMVSPTVPSAFGLQGQAAMRPPPGLPYPTGQQLGQAAMRPPRGLPYPTGQQLPMMPVPGRTPALSQQQPEAGGLPQGITAGLPLLPLPQNSIQPGFNQAGLYQGGFGHGGPPLATNFGPPPARKPRVPDAMAQQQYEAYIEYRKATDPKYALECKQRQAKRAARSNTQPSSSSSKTVLKHGV